MFDSILQIESLNVRKEEHDKQIEQTIRLLTTTTFIFDDVFDDVFDDDIYDKLN